MVQFYSKKQDTSQAIKQYLASGGIIQKLTSQKSERQLIKVKPSKRKLFR